MHGEREVKFIAITMREQKILYGNIFASSLLENQNDEKTSRIRQTKLDTPAIVHAFCRLGAGFYLSFRVYRH